MERKYEGNCVHVFGCGHILYGCVGFVCVCVCVIHPGTWGENTSGRTAVSGVREYTDGGEE